MKENKEARISYWAAHLTTIISVTLVLVLIGIIALISVAAAGETRRLKEKIELSVVLNDSVPDTQAYLLRDKISEKPYAKEVTVVTRDEALENWKKDTGEDLEQLFGVNPLSPEVSFTINADYASPSYIASIKKNLSSLPMVAEVATPDIDTVSTMNENIGSLTLILAIIAVVMVSISFVLINNTVHLTIYSRRFTIHTMQLVGATGGFIRRPFISNNILSGLISGCAASAVIAVSLVCAPHSGIMTPAAYISWPVFGIIAAGLILIGAFICGIAAWIATSKYLNKDYDKLFR